MNALERAARDAALGFRGGSADLDFLARAVCPLIRKISSAVAYQIRMDVSEDVAASVWLAFQEKGVYQWDETRSIGAYLSVIARNVALLMLRQEQMYAVAQVDNDGEEIETTEESELSVTSSHHSEDPYQSVEKIVAIGEIKQKLMYAANSNSTWSPDSGIKIKVKAEQKSYTLGPQHQELTEIYKRLRGDSGMTQMNFAKNLNIGLARLSSYLYGRTASVPDYVMDAARLILRSPDHTKVKLN